ncbi:MAG: hypothetical protein DRO23_09750 [Thermoprotei archaeon]|nr:MAG: hypothetical protein DRO23_09750 [Thermoprotei archaeon]
MPYLFTLLIMLYALVLFFIAYKVKTLSFSLALFAILTACLWLRIFPYIDGIPLGVDPIRDIIYSYNVVLKARLIYNMPYFVKYYEYFPATQLLSSINAIVSGLDITCAHYLTLSTLSSLGIIPLILILRNVAKLQARLIILAGLLYATIPTIATWGYWVIPMTFSILLSIFSLMFFTKYMKEPKLEFIFLSLAFSMLSVMVHAVVGALTLGFYIVYTIIIYFGIRKHKNTNTVLLKPLTLYSTILAAYTVFYWNMVGFIPYLTRYVSLSYLRIIRILSKPLKLVAHGTRSVILPTTPKISVAPSYPQILEFMPKEYPMIYIAPRWIWSILIATLPLLLLTIIKKRKIRINMFTLALGIYSILILLFTALSIYFNIVWKADRYLASPITPYVIIFIVASFYAIIKYKVNMRLGSFLATLMLILVITSVLDPRVSFYTNPAEGDRVSFKSSEKLASKYLFSTWSTGYIISDHGLMTSYLRYLASLNNLTRTEVSFCSLRHRLGKKFWNKDWVFLFRKYSVESYYIWSLNYAGKPQVVNEVFYKTNLIYDNRECLIFKSIAAKK